MVFIFSLSVCDLNMTLFTTLTDQQPHLLSCVEKLESMTNEKSQKGVNYEVDNEPTTYRISAEKKKQCLFYWKRKWSYFYNKQSDIGSTILSIVSSESQVSVEQRIS